MESKQLSTLLVIHVQRNFGHFVPGRQWTRVVLYYLPYSTVDSTSAVSWWGAGDPHSCPYFRLLKMHAYIHVNAKPHLSAQVSELLVS